jgi:isoleucyl-tRNA synthetase
MGFAKVESAVDFPALERQILQWWEQQGIFEKRRALNAGKPRWSFLDGPITANNPMGVHHAWGRTYKDVYHRYFAMTGHDMRYQNGFDCQGLWVEVEVEKELGLKSKRDIENLVPGDVEASIDLFVRHCKARVDKYARIQTEQSIRLGYWMDWDRSDADWAKRPEERKSYFTMSEENNYTIWAFLKKCHQRGLIYRGYDVMPWCGRCGVGISEMEMKEGYRLVEHKACFVRFPLLDRPQEYLLVWTTTPWTLTSNVGAAVNPQLSYLRVRVGDEIYYLAEGAFRLDRMAAGGAADADELENPEGASASGRGRRAWLAGVPPLRRIEQWFAEKAGPQGYEVVGSLRGADMLGWRYSGPFDEFPAQQHPYGYPEAVARVTQQAGYCPAISASQAHRVISGGDAVTAEEGTGIVHVAPGCGGIDYLWGKDNGLPPIAPIGDDGVFLEGFGEFTGRNAADPATADAVLAQLRHKGFLFAWERYVHRYPHCWRCKTELLYRLVDEWFIHMGPRHSEEGFRGDIMRVVRRPDVRFLPEEINGRARELDWLRNMGDWMISKKRYWGLALPIWVDEEDPTQFDVIGSRQELQQRAVAGWELFEGHTPHRPWIDKVKIRNPRTGRLMHRIPDVGNPWLDAGIVAFSTLKWNSDRDYWRRWYPADFITESFPGQFRNWFYALLAMSTMMSDGQPPFRTLLGHGLVRDQYGQEMHKSAGNAIEFIAAADTGGVIRDPKGKQIPFRPMGADVMRWMYVRHNPAANLNFGPAPADDIRSRVFFKLWNTYAMFCNYAIGDGYDPLTAPPIPVSQRPDVDRWLLSNLQLLIHTARQAYSSYNVMAFALECEKFIEADLSNWYVRRNKDRLHSRHADLDDQGRRDKWAAYHTLYTTLRTLCQLMAPCIPFITEAMWQNLRRDPDPQSVHLCDFPTPDDSLIDRQLSADMATVQRLVSLGLAARQLARINVRQPLRALVLAPATPEERRAAERFQELILEELNVKILRFHTDPKPLLTIRWQLNKKNAAPKLGPRLADAEAELARYGEPQPPQALAGVELTAADFTPEYIAPSGWVGTAERGTQIALDITITPELRREGWARLIVRHIQEARKKAGLDLLDKIALYVHANTSELQQTLSDYRSTIAIAVQARHWSEQPLDGSCYQEQITLPEGTLQVQLRKV